MTRSSEEVTIGKREVQGGEVDVRKRVETERVREPATLRHEEVHVERRPVTGAAARDAEIGDEDVRIPVTREDAVVEKRPVVEEEVVISKRPVEEQRTIETDVRRERIDVRRDDVPGREERDRVERDRKR